MKLMFPALLSFSVGFLSLSQEILWTRLLSFAQGGAPIAFAFVLSLYLVGIAAGALVGRMVVKRGANLYLAAGITLTLAALTDPLPVFLGPIFAFKGSLALGNTVLPAFFIVLSAGIKSVLFPIAHQLGARDLGGLGASVSNIYFANVLGSTAGPLFTGFFLLDAVSLDTAFAMVGVSSFGVALVCFVLSVRRQLLLGALSASLLYVVVLWGSTSSERFVRASGERWYAWGESRKQVDGRITKVVENKHGVIHVVALEGRKDDVVYGGNVYDGRITTDPRLDSNGISRIYWLLSGHPGPEEILVIGLSGGSWTKALLSDPRVSIVQAVEINPGYIELIRQTEAVSPLLQDPRLGLAIDDGRRWLRRHPDRKFDLIVANSTFHWRAYATTLLSREFFQLARERLKPGGILALNPTGAPDVFKTASEVFKSVVSMNGFLYASDDLHAWDWAADIRISRMKLFRDSGAPLFSEQDFAALGAGDRISKFAAKNWEEIVPSAARPGIITDRNLLTEYRHGKLVTLLAGFLGFDPPPLVRQ